MPPATPAKPAPSRHAQAGAPAADAPPTAATASTAAALDVGMPAAARTPPATHELSGTAVAGAAAAAGSRQQALPRHDATRRLFGQEVVGSLVRAQWPETQGWVSGVVREHRGAGVHLVEYAVTEPQLGLQRMELHRVLLQIKEGGTWRQYEHGREVPLECQQAQQLTQQQAQQPQQQRQPPQQQRQQQAHHHMMQQQHAQQASGPSYLAPLPSDPQQHLLSAVQRAHQQKVQQLSRQAKTQRALSRQAMVQGTPALQQTAAAVQQWRTGQQQQQAQDAQASTYHALLQALHGQQAAAQHALAPPAAARQAEQAQQQDPQQLIAGPQPSGRTLHAAQLAGEQPAAAGRLPAGSSERSAASGEHAGLQQQHSQSLQQQQQQQQGGQGQLAAAASQRLMLPIPAAPASLPQQQALPSGASRASEQGAAAACKCEDVQGEHGDQPAAKRRCRDRGAGGHPQQAHDAALQSRHEDQGCDLLLAGVKAEEPASSSGPAVKQEPDG
ncbi:hypothetical protein ABPG75_000940 [Micractinium tetrahymenae]